MGAGFSCDISEKRPFVSETTMSIDRWFIQSPGKYFLYKVPAPFPNSFNWRLPRWFCYSKPALCYKKRWRRNSSPCKSTAVGSPRTKVSGEFLCVERGAHEHHLQVGAHGQQVLDDDQQDVRLQVPLVDLVQNQVADGGQQADREDQSSASVGWWGGSLSLSQFNWKSLLAWETYIYIAKASGKKQI